MKLLQWTLQVGMFALLATGAWLTCARWAGLDDVDLAAVLTAAEQIEHEQRRLAEGEAILEAIHRRIEARRWVVADVISGRLSLQKAATRFRELDRQPPPVNLEIVRSIYPGQSDDERYCRRVIEAVQIELHHQGPRREAIVSRLEAELERLFRRPPPSFCQTRSA